MNNVILKVNSKKIDILDKSNFTFDFLDPKFRKLIKHSPSLVGLDFLFIGLFVSYIDKTIKRSETKDAWTRSIRATFPVLEIDKWRGNESILSKMLSFLSGDNWDVDFEAREITDIENKFLNRKHVRNIEFNSSSISRICMFSGGLDSFIGAIDLLEQSNSTVFINIHGGGNSYEKNFNEVRNVLSSQFNITNNDCYFRTFKASPRGKVEDTTRARSFTFFTHAIALSTCFKNVKELIIPENGTISLNVPLTIARNGSCSTRTTHPYYISMLQSLITNMGLRLTLVNPYQFCTKGEMIINSKNREFLDSNIRKTMSCSHPTASRYHRRLGRPSHCGYCLPCIIRRAAEYKAYGRLDATHYLDIDEPSKTNQSTIRCLKLRINSFKEKNSLIEIQKNGPLFNNIKEFQDLYKRSIEELKTFLNVYVKPD